MWEERGGKTPPVWSLNRGEAFPWLVHTTRGLSQVGEAVKLRWVVCKTKAIRSFSERLLRCKSFPNFFFPLQRSFFYPDLDLMEHGIYGVMAWVLGVISEPMETAPSHTQNTVQIYGQPYKCNGGNEATGDWRIWPHIFKILMFDFWVECTVFDINLHNRKKLSIFYWG